MKNTDFYTKTLVDVGLSENEAKVYIATLSLAETTVLQLARVTDIKRTTVYHLVESLTQKGLLATSMRGFKSFIIAQDPTQLTTLLSARASAFEGILPDLQAKYQTKNKQGEIKEYRGLAAIKRIYENLLTEIQPHEDYLVISNQEDWHALDPDFFQAFIEKRAKLPINIRVLLTDTPLAREHKKFEKNFNETIELLPKSTNLSTNLIITPQKVVIHRLVEPVSALVLTDPTIVQMHKESFEIMWNSITNEKTFAHIEGK